MSQTPKSRTRRRLLALALGLASLVVLELILRAAGIADPRLPLNMALPLAGPAFVRDGQTYHTNPERRATFADQTFPAHKAPGTLRVFIVGGSAAMGFPMEAAFSPARVLEAQLRALYPVRPFEIINAAGFGLASYRAEAVLKEVLAYEPDAVVFMSGNNEFLEWRFDRRDLGPFTRALVHLRLYRVLSALALKARGRAHRVDWESHTISAAERKAVIRDFQRTLDRAVTACRRRQVPLILATCPANLKDFRPLGPSAVSREDMEQADGMVRSGRLLMARDYLKKLAAKHPADAWLSFEQGWVLHGLSPAADPERRNFAAALKWTVAKDNDSRPVRALEEINRAVRETAASDGLQLLDLEAAFLQAAHGAPGNELFFDHCHPNPDGELLIGPALLAALSEAGLVELGAGWDLVSRGAIENLRASVPDSAWADAWYRGGYETGVNLGRIHRGLDLARRAHELDPSHVKAGMLMERLTPLAEAAVRLTGD